ASRLRPDRARGRGADGVAQPRGRSRGSGGEALRRLARARSPGVLRHRRDAGPGTRARPRDQRPAAPRRGAALKSRRIRRRNAGVTEAALDKIRAIVGPKGWIADPAGIEPYLVEERGLYRG